MCSRKGKKCNAETFNRIYFSIFILSYENCLLKAGKCFQSMIVSWHQKIKKMKWNIQWKIHQEKTKKKRTIWIFYIYLRVMCICFTGLSILIGLQPTVVVFTLVQLKNPVVTFFFFFSILPINRSIVGVIMLTPVSWQDANSGNYILPM